jgi:hypothetical protein
MATINSDLGCGSAIYYGSDMQPCATHSLPPQASTQQRIMPSFVPAPTDVVIATAGCASKSGVSLATVSKLQHQSRNTCSHNHYTTQPHSYSQPLQAQTYPHVALPVNAPTYQPSCFSAHVTSTASTVGVHNSVDAKLLVQQPQQQQQQQQQQPRRQQQQPTKTTATTQQQQQLQQRRRQLAFCNSPSSSSSSARVEYQQVMPMPSQSQQQQPHLYDAYSTWSSPNHSARQQQQQQQQQPLAQSQQQPRFKRKASFLSPTSSPVSPSASQYRRRRKMSSSSILVSPGSSPHDLISPQSAPADWPQLQLQQQQHYQQFPPHQFLPPPQQHLQRSPVLSPQGVYIARPNGKRCELRRSAHSSFRPIRQHSPIAVAPTIVATTPSASSQISSSSSFSSFASSVTPPTAEASTPHAQAPVVCKQTPNEIQALRDELNTLLKHVTNSQGRPLNTVYTTEEIVRIVQTLPMCGGGNGDFIMDLFYIPDSLDEFKKVENAAVERVSHLNAGGVRLPTPHDAVIDTFKIILNRVPFATYIVPLRHGAVYDRDAIWVSDRAVEVFGWNREEFKSVLATRQGALHHLYPKHEHERCFKEVTSQVASQRRSATSKFDMLDSKGEVMPCVITRLYKYHGKVPSMMITFVQTKFEIGTRPRMASEK